MAKSLRIEGVAGGSSGLSGKTKGLSRAEIKKIQKAKPLANPKSAVKVKPAAKQKPNSPNAAKVFDKTNQTRNRAYQNAYREYEETAGRHGNLYEAQAMAREAMLSAKPSRKISIANKKLTAIKKNKATTPRTSKDTTWSTKKPIKIGGGVLGALKKQIENAKPLSKAEAKANKRGLKAANKPTNKIGSKADRLERKIVNKNFNAPAKTSYVKQLRREAASKKK